MLLVLGGCSAGGPTYLPLTPGKTWTYSVRSGFQSNVVTMKVGRAKNVGEYHGRVIESPLGDSELAWAGPKLISDQFANSRFSPPICIFNEAKIPAKKKPRDNEFVEVETWNGRIESFGVQRSAKAKLRQRRSSILLSSGQTQVVETVLEIELKSGKIEVRSWFERGKGIVRQEQRTLRNFVVSMELLRVD